MALIHDKTNRRVRGWVDVKCFYNFTGIAIYNFKAVITNAYARHIWVLYLEPVKKIIVGCAIAGWNNLN